MLQLATDDLATELETRDELLAACREVLAGSGTSAARALVQHIDALLDLDETPEAAPQDGFRMLLKVETVGIEPTSATAYEQLLRA